MARIIQMAAGTEPAAICVVRAIRGYEI
jgi:hypothetical protein